MGVTNVLKEHEAAYRAAVKTAVTSRINVVDPALALLERVALWVEVLNTHKPDTDLMKQSLNNNYGDVWHSLLELVDGKMTGDQFTETFDADFDYGEMRANREFGHWQDTAAARAEALLECSMNEAVLAAIILQGQAILRASA